jgi:hypothetical protein
MTIADERFFAWLDGELPPEEAASVEAEVARSPELTRAAHEHRAMQAQLKAAFDTIAEAPVPQGLPAANVINFAAAQRRRGSRRWGSSMQWAAIAATLALGVLTGTMISPLRSGPVDVRDGKLYAAADLNDALDKELASAPAAGAPVSIGITFRDQSGAICRTFTNAQSSGLACRDGERWQLRGLFAAPEGQRSAYRMAGSADPNLAALVDSVIAGEPFDAHEERAAEAGKWR